jgi:hypothetical protein
VLSRSRNITGALNRETVRKGLRKETCLKNGHVHYNDTPSTSNLELRTAYGPVFRDVLNVPPRDCTAEEIPIIDLSPLDSSKLEDWKDLAKEIRAVEVNTGFFYIKNHAIDETIIADAQKQLLA